MEVKQISTMYTVCTSVRLIFTRSFAAKIVSLKDPRRWSSEGIRYTAGSARSDKRGVKPIATISDHVDYDIQ